MLPTYRENTAPYGPLTLNSRMYANSEWSSEHKTLANFLKIKDGVLIPTFRLDDESNWKI